MCYRKSSGNHHRGPCGGRGNWISSGTMVAGRYSSFLRHSFTSCDCDRIHSLLTVLGISVSKVGFKDASVVCDIWIYESTFKCHLIIQSALKSFICHLCTILLNFFFSFFLFMANDYHTSKMIIEDIQKRIWVVVSYKRLVLHKRLYLTKFMVI